MESTESWNMHLLAKKSWSCFVVTTDPALHWNSGLGCLWKVRRMWLWTLLAKKKGPKIRKRDQPAVGCALSTYWATKSGHFFAQFLYIINTGQHVAPFALPGTLGRRSCNAFASGPSASWPKCLASMHQAERGFWELSSDSWVKFLVASGCYKDFNILIYTQKQHNHSTIIWVRVPTDISWILMYLNVDGVSFLVCTPVLTMHCRF